MSTLPSIPETVREFRLCEPHNRTRRLQVLIGDPTTDPTLLHWRALLVTALNDAELWPPRKRSGK